MLLRTELLVLLLAAGLSAGCSGLVAAEGAGSRAGPADAGRAPEDAGGALDAGQVDACSGCGVDAEPCDPGCADPSGWPTSAAGALSRSPYWNPASQVVHEGDYRTEMKGQLIEDLHIVGGSLFVAHDDVVVRNVRSDGATCEDAGNHPIRILSGAHGVVLDGVQVGATEPCWDTMCNRPIFPGSGIIAYKDSAYTVRGCATSQVGDGFKFLPGAGGSINAVIEDCFVEVAQGIWAVTSQGACQPDHVDGMQVQSSGPLSLTVRRTSLDALPYQRASRDAPLTQPSGGGGAAFMFNSSVAADLAFDTVRFHSGNVNLNFAGRAAALRMERSESSSRTAPFHGPSNLTIGSWVDNSLAAGGAWDAP